MTSLSGSSTIRQSHFFDVHVKYLSSHPSTSEKNTLSPSFRILYRNTKNLWASVDSQYKLHSAFNTNGWQETGRKAGELDGPAIDSRLQPRLSHLGWDLNGDQKRVV